MKNRFLRASAYLLVSLAIIFAVSIANASDSTSFNPTSVTVEVDAIIGVPIGGVIPWPASTPPKDYLECNGQSFSAATYPKLQAMLGATVVPNYQNEFLRGSSAGRAVGTKQGDAIRNITGSIGSVSSLGGGSGAFRSVRNHHYGGDQGGDRIETSFYFDASRSVPTANENRPRNVAVMYIIRAK